ncbi:MULTISPECIES: ABC transporter substrate-binding protein [Actinoalloteichus]|uniref:ABC-type Fe3+-hydroxamate transport system, periplasmic component n=1 Tax=Actinoalloteichus fjordicus TaxID=1612552 RepID=A0AAC9LFG5_9PSEU|nr:MULTISPECIES: ABC transporter substrate-binding protein [Actinoalloteichus]APU15900.1 ABC-type Fe3+-hydroxamate transport system, periplasmic component [Actinoalloteichus fjordicus]APU21962.1 ABC-type Fe3+-hydroxamate transport system, periplasmic component [Actinoalloteichus sp. GBA129-24]
MTRPHRLPIARLGAATAVRPLDRRRFLSGLGIGVLALGVAGCASGDAEGGGDAAGETRPFQHPLGRSDLPAEPRRIVSLDPGAGLQVALEHGVPLVASATLASEPSVPAYLPSPAAPFEQLGFNQADPERVSGFEPDLIVGHVPSLQEDYALYSEITTTVSYTNSAGGTEWEDACLTVADYYGVRDEQQQRIDEFHERADAFAQTHAETLNGLRVVLLRFTTDELRIVTDSVIFGSRVLTRAGVQLTESSATSGPEETYVSVTPEQVSRLEDADVVLYFGGGGAYEEGNVTSAFTTYTEGTLWGRLPAVQAGRVFEVPQTTWWDGYSTSAAHAALDDLEDIVGQLG